MQPAIQSVGEASDQRQSSLALPSRKEERLKDALAALSIANLCFLHVWTQVVNLASEPATRYYETQPPEMSYLLALLLDVLVTAVIVFCAIRLCRAASLAARSIGALVVAGFGIYALYGASKSLKPAFDYFFTYHGQVALKGLILLALAFAFFRYRQRAAQAARTGFFVLSPLFFIMAAHGLWAYVTNNLHSAGRGHSAGMLQSSTRSNRLIWVIFDELDNRLLFQARPARVQAPEFDRLRQQALYAGHVTTPAEETLRAIPSLFLGKLVTDTKIDTSKLLIKTSDSPSWQNFSTQPNVFHKARAEGFNTALSGWNHPYCRIMGGDLSECAWDNGGWTDVFVERHLREISFLDQAFYMAHWQSRVSPLHREPPQFIAPNALTFYRQNNIAVLKYVWEHGDRMLRNPALNLVLLHFPVPHSPGIWDPKREQFTTANANYIDNLALADRILGNIRRDLEATGDWDRSTILITGDHPYRAPMWLAFSDIRTPEMIAATGEKRYPFVPLLLKLPGQHSASSYKREFSNIVSAELILDVLNGKLSKPEDAAAWLDSHIAKPETQ